MTCLIFIKLALSLVSSKPAECLWHSRQPAQEQTSSVGTVLLQNREGPGGKGRKPKTQPGEEKSLNLQADGEETLFPKQDTSF